ncbi:unnamed protein product [Dicrocoelium dendriticum]|nr:unnamed protein product [Dicrocoelium dendriticum]
METLFAAATSIVGRTQPSLDGGLFMFFLEYFLPLPSPTGANASAEQKRSVTEHVLSTYSRAGYASAISFSAIWSISLVSATLFVCCRRRHKTKRSARIALLTDASRDLTTMHTSRASGTGLLRMQRERLQSNWLWLATQFLFFIILIVLLGAAVLLGFSMSSQLQVNLSSPPAYEEAVGRLLNSAELEHTNPQKTHVFPRVLRALAQVRAYFNEFVNITRTHTAPIVDELISATEQMQERMTADFNSLLFEKIGATEAFELGDFLGRNVISLVEHSMAIVNQDAIFKNHFDRLKVELQAWLRLINSYGPGVNDPDCDSRCLSLRATFTNNLTTRPDTFMPVFSFAIALKFVTTDQNQTAANIREQLNRGKVLASHRLMETKRIMSERIDIPNTILKMTSRQWDVLDSQMSWAIQAVDNAASKVTEFVVPKVLSGSVVILALGCIFWIVLLLFTLGVTWIVIYYHCVPSELGPRNRHRLRTASGFGLVLLLTSLLFATAFFLVGGYLYTEACRYIDPEQTRVTVVKHEGFKEAYTKHHFPLDSHINAFITQHWPFILYLVAQNNPLGTRPLPVPHVRSPIYALSHNCRKNMGILEATDAITDLDMTSLNDPEMSKRFVNTGREIMIDSLKSLDAEEMFPRETDEQLSLAGRLDDFIVDFDGIRARLPTTYVSVYDSENGSNDYRPFSQTELWVSWNSYYTDILQHRLSRDQNARLVSATQQVDLRLRNLVAVVETMSDHLKNLSTAKKIGPVVLQLKSVLARLKELMTNKPALTELADKLFEKHISAVTPGEVVKLIAKFGPRIMAEVGRCRRLYEAAKDLNDAICGGVVNVLNGFWFVCGWIALVGTLIITFGSLLLLRKPVRSTGKPFTKTYPSFNTVCVRRRRNEASTNTHPGHTIIRDEGELLNPSGLHVGPSQLCTVSSV